MKNRAPGLCSMRLLHSIALPEAFHAATSVDDALLASIERMAFPTNFNVHIVLGRTYMVHCATRTSYGCPFIRRMNICLHSIHLLPARHLKTSRAIIANQSYDGNQQRAHYERIMSALPRAPGSTAENAGDKWFSLPPDGNGWGLTEKSNAVYGIPFTQSLDSASLSVNWYSYLSPLLVNIKRERKYMKIPSSN